MSHLKWDICGFWTSPWHVSVGDETAQCNTCPCGLLKPHLCQIMTSNDCCEHVQLQKPGEGPAGHDLPYREPTAHVPLHSWLHTFYGSWFNVTSWAIKGRIVNVTLSMISLLTWIGQSDQIGKKLQTSALWVWIFHIETQLMQLSHRENQSCRWTAQKNGFKLPWCATIRTLLWVGGMMPCPQY